MSEYGNDIIWLKTAIAEIQRGQAEILKIVTELRLAVARHDEIIDNTVGDLSEVSSDLMAIQKVFISDKECRRNRNECSAKIDREEDRKEKRIQQLISIGAILVAVISIIASST